MQRHLMDYSSKKSITWLNIHPVGRLIFIFFKVVHTFFFHIKEEEVVRLFFWDANVASTEHWELLFSYSFKVVGAWNPGDFHHQVSSLFASLTNYSSSSSCWLLSFSIKVRPSSVHQEKSTRTNRWRKYLKKTFSSSSSFFYCEYWNVIILERERELPASPSSAGKVFFFAVDLRSFFLRSFLQVEINNKNMLRVVFSVGPFSFLFCVHFPSLADGSSTTNKYLNTHFILFEI